MHLRFMGYGAFALFCSWPFVNFWNQNLEWLNLGDVPILMCILVPVIVLGLVFLYIIERVAGLAQMPRWFVAASAIAFLLFHYPEIMSVSRSLFGALDLHIAPHYGYAAVFIGVPLILVAVTNRNILVQISFIFAVSVNVIPGLAIVWTEAFDTDTQAEKRDPAAQPWAKSKAHTVLQPRPLAVTKTNVPNVYHILTDGYARADQLKRVLGFDNSEFLGGLSDRGFRVVEKAMTNYPQTVFALGSMFSMDYPYTEKDTYKDYKRLTGILSGTNHVYEGFLKRGYTIGLGGSGIWSQVTCHDHPKVICLTRDQQVVRVRSLEIAAAVNKMTAFSYFVTVFGISGHVTTVSDIQHIIGKVRLPEPIMVYAHTLPPHNPYVSKADCSDRLGVEFTLSGGLNKEHYLGALQCVSKRLLAISDYLMEKDPTAIVIFNSDHGSRFLTDWTKPNDAWSKNAFEERFSTFLAVRGPKLCQDQLPNDISLVNLYRFIFSCIDGVEPRYLSNKHYITADKGFTGFGKLHRYSVSAGANKK